MKNIISLLLITSVLIIHKSHADELPKKELRAIAETYIEALEDGDYYKLSCLFVDPAQLNRRQFNDFSSKIKNMKLKKIDDNNVLIGIQLKPKQYFLDFNVTGDLTKAEPWLILTSTGKIKYDSLLLRHPVEKAYFKLREFNIHYTHANIKSPPDKSYIRDAQKALNEIHGMGVPVYDLDVNEGMSHAEGELKKIIAWLNENGDNLDTSEPKVTWPEALRKKYKNKPL